VLNFNGSAIIRECVDALLRQDYPNFEIIVVENGSGDESLDVLTRAYGEHPKIHIAASAKNLGCPGGRNFGLRFARGEIVAFIDNDAVAQTDWLSRAIARLESDSAIGGVASLLVFEQRPEIINSAGGTFNLLGYGGDICYKAHAEFAELPDEVLYASGCGMVYRRSIFEGVGTFDSQLFNYYDDADMGIRAWRMGKRVVLAPDAHIVHKFSYSDTFNKNKAYLCERNRIRTVLKHFPLRALIQWLPQELRHEFRRRHPRSIFMKAWWWNLMHAPSTLKWRWRLKRLTGDFSKLLVNDTGYFPYATPNNMSFAPNRERLPESIDFKKSNGTECLNHGWYEPERAAHSVFRWTEKVSACMVHLASRRETMNVGFRFPPVERYRCDVYIRKLPDIQTITHVVINGENGTWQRTSFPVNLEPGVYEVVLKVDQCFIDRGKRTLGIAISDIHFE